MRKILFLIGILITLSVSAQQTNDMFVSYNFGFPLINAKPAVPATDKYKMRLWYDTTLSTASNHVIYIYNPKVSIRTVSTLIFNTNNGAEYTDYQTGDYSVNIANGNIQNIVFQLSANATLTLPTPTTTMVIYVSTMTSFHLNTSQNIYTDDLTWNTFISNQRVKLVYNVSKGKWYILSS